MLENILDRITPAHKRRAADYPYLLTGESDGLLRLLPADLANVAAVAIAPGEAQLLVTDNFRDSDKLREIERRLGKLGWKTSIAVEPGSAILSRYGHAGSQRSNVQGDRKSANTAKFDQYLESAIAARASEIKFCVRGETCGVLYAVDGKVYLAESIPARLGVDLCSNVYSTLADPTSFEPGKSTFSPEIDQSCAVFREIGGAVYKLRYQSLPEADGGFDVNLRILAQGSKGTVPTLENLDFTPSAIVKLKRAMARRRGAIYACGPVGQGKTTTLYALLYRPQAQRHYYALAFEDPPEYNQVGITRVPVRKIGYEQAVLCTLRMGAHIAMIGEIRGPEMGMVAKVLSETGQKVATTVHVNSANRIIPRLCSEEIRLPRQSMCDTDMIALLFYQQLLPKLCGCKRHATPELLGERMTTELERLEIPLSSVRLRNPDGCPQCRGGRRGRLPVVEIIEPDEAYLRLMSEGRDLDAKRYWLNTCTTRVCDEDVTGKPAMGTALYRVASGDLDPFDLETELEPLDGYQHVMRASA